MRRRATCSPRTRVRNGVDLQAEFHRWLIVCKSNLVRFVFCMQKCDSRLVATDHLAPEVSALLNAAVVGVQRRVEMLNVILSVEQSRNYVLFGGNGQVGMGGG